MKKGRFLWSAHRITEKQKAGKARNIKEKQLKNLRSTAGKPPAALPSSPSAEFYCFGIFKPRESQDSRGFGRSARISPAFMRFKLLTRKITANLAVTF